MRLPSRLALAACLLVAPAAPAAAATVRIDYTITLAGLTIGSADLEGAFDEARYDVKLAGKLTGLAGAFSGGSQGAASAQGIVSAGRLVSTGFAATGRSSSTERTVRMGLQGGNVTALDISPPFEERPERVPVTPANKRGITDPVTGLVALAADKAKPVEPATCNRTLPVFDGTQRFDLVMSYGGTRLVRKPGYTVNVLVCNIRYRAVAGHRPDRPAVKFMEENRDMSVWLAPVDGTRALVPIRIALQTMVGMSVIEAERWRVEPAEGRALTR